jgi:2-polyprenyl-3-methyl-5-hydroxy-6-metoxy-1,4-benzoquinol methylase
MRNALVRVIGWPATVLHGDPLMIDRWRWLRRHLREGPLRTLDVGCGSGAFTLYAARRGNVALGLSWDEGCNRIARERARILGLDGAEFLECDVRELDRGANGLGRFDQIICMETIEHIKDDRKLVADLAALLEPGGRLLLTTPAGGHRPLVGDDMLSETEDGGHVRYGYTTADLRALFAGAALEVVSEEALGGVVSQQLANLTRLLAAVNGRLAWALVFPLRAAQVLDRPLTSLLGYPFFGIGVVAERRAGR